MSSIIFSFERLEVWKLAKELSIKVHHCTKLYPAEEKFNLVSQTRRAALSVCSNIAEGSSRISGKDQAHFTSIAYGSLMELGSHLIIAKELGYLDSNVLALFKIDIQNLASKLTNLRFYQLNKYHRV